MPKHSFHDLDEKQWFDQLLKSNYESVPGLPAFPQANLQDIFVGKSGEAALAEAFAIYKLLKARATLTRETNVLDFGVGYGRILRLFVKDVDSAHLYGVDVDRAILDEATRLGVEGTLLQIDPMGELPFPDCFFDIAYGFSVFSHLSPSSAHHWCTDLMRSIRPGGLLAITTTTDRFLNLCLACSLKEERDRSHYEQIYAKLFHNPQVAIDSYKTGKYVFSGCGGHASVLKPDNYGWAAMPRRFVEDALGAYASHIEFIDDESVCEQGIFLIRKI
jgi:SAM-dependent methyltransferase